MKIKKMVNYKLWLNDRGEKIVPPHIKDGGYYLEEDGSMIGILEVDHDVYIPMAFTEISEEELSVRITSLRKMEESGESCIRFDKRLSVDEETKLFLRKIVD